MIPGRESPVSRCVLFGHEWRMSAGAGQFRHQQFLVCDACGKTIPAGAAAAPERRDEPPR